MDGNPAVESDEKRQGHHSMSASINNVKEHSFDISGRVTILVVLCIFTLHGAFLVWGSSLVWQTDLVWVLFLAVGLIDVMLLARICRPTKAKDWWYHPMVIHLIVAIVTTWLILVGMYIDPVNPDSDSTFLNISANSSEEDIQRQLQASRTSDAKTSVNVIFSSVQKHIGLSINFTQDFQFDTVAYIGVQLVTPVIVFARWLMPRIDLTSDQLSKLLITGVAMSFDIVELQDNIQNEDLRNNETLAYLILVFTSLSLLQLLQLSEALAARVVASRRWEMFWTLYGVVFQEIPFLIIRIYIMIVTGFEMIQLIFPLKNAFSILFGFYHLYALRKTEKEEREEQLRDMTSQLGPGVAQPSRHSLSQSHDNKHKATTGGQLGFAKQLFQWMKQKRTFSLIAPILLLFSHLVLLIWRVTVTHNNPKFWLLTLTAIPFVVITVLRIIQHRRGISSENMRVSFWYQPLLLYLLVAISCFWLIVLGLVDRDVFLVDKSSTKLAEQIVTEACNVSSQDLERTMAVELNITHPLGPQPNTSSSCRLFSAQSEASDPELSDEVSYALLQLVLPLAVFGRWLMPREQLSPEAFSNLLQVAVAMAFDIAEFTHLIVDEPDLHKDRLLLIFVMLFTSTSILLLVQIDVGLASDSKLGEIVWTLLTILFFDGPFFVVRLFVASDYSAEDLQLVFLLKNVFGVVFGGYRIFTLLRSKERVFDVGKDEAHIKQQHRAGQVPEDHIVEMYVNRRDRIMRKSVVKGVHSHPNNVVSGGAFRDADSDHCSDIAIKCHVEETEDVMDSCSDRHHRNIPIPSSEDGVRDGTAGQVDVIGK